MARFTLPKFVDSFKLINENGTPSTLFHRWWQEVVNRLEEAISDLVTVTDDLATSLKLIKLSDSGVSGLTLTASHDSVNDIYYITVSDHTRIYSNGESVSVTGEADIVASGPEVLQYVYYDDAAQAGGAVTYSLTTDMGVAAQTGDRHLVGFITTPTAAGADTGGGSNPPPGYGGTFPEV